MIRLVAAAAVVVALSIAAQAHENRYPAVVTAVYDGDTMTLDIDLGQGIVREGVRVRLLGLDTPEVRGEERMEGLRVRDWVRRKVLGKRVILETDNDETGKFGRLLGIIWIDGRNLNRTLLDTGRAEPVDY